MTLYRLQKNFLILASLAITGQSIGEQAASLLEQDSKLVRHEVHQQQQLEDGEQAEDMEEDLEDDADDEEGDEDEDGGSDREAPTPEELSDLHKKIDANGDGKASMAEVVAYAKEMTRVAVQQDAESLMQDLDTNGDGKLSVEEFLEDLKQDSARTKRDGDTLDMEVRKFKAADEDDDGFLSSEELLSIVEPNTKRNTRDLEVADILRRRDKDGDNHVSLLEYVDGERHERQARADNGDEEEAAELLEEDEDHRATTDAELKAEFAHLDTDKNGKLSFQELQAMHHIEDIRLKEDAQELFDEVDEDKDGHLSEQEMLNARETIIDSPLVQEWAEIGAFVEKGETDDEEDDELDDEEEEED